MTCPSLGVAQFPVAIHASFNYNGSVSITCRVSARLLLLALLPTQHGCSVSGQRATEVSGPGGGRSQLIECAGDAASCYRKASRLCPEGYRIETHGMSEKAVGAGQNGSVTMRELLVTCTDGGSQQMSDADPPTGAGGFVFGADLASGNQACVNQGFRPGHVAGNHLCHGIHPDIGIKGITYLTTCSDKLCEIDMIAPIPESEDEVILKQWRDLKWRISQRYGSPYDQELIPDRCRGHLRKCVASSEGAAHITWRWRTGHTVSLHLVANDGEAVLRLVYSAPKASQPGDGPAL